MMIVSALIPRETAERPAIVLVHGAANSAKPESTEGHRWTA